MKAVFFREHGGPEKLSYEELSMPKVGPQDVLIRVKACALNHLDLWVRQGSPTYTVPYPTWEVRMFPGPLNKWGPKSKASLSEHRSLCHPVSVAGIASSAWLGGTICAERTIFWEPGRTAAMPSM